MKTIILTINTREAFGDKAVATTVGVYQVEHQHQFNLAVKSATETLLKRGCIPASDRASEMRKLLSYRGFRPLQTTGHFIAIF
jgi:hypothetical protein